MLLLTAKLERDNITPAFPFGFGLSYTAYTYSNLKLEQAQLESSDTLKLILEVSNTGTQLGEEVVQVYVSALGSRVERVKKELKAFARVALQVGETKTVKLEIPVLNLAYYDEAKEAFVVEEIESQ